ncbi:hypothetical protein [Yinghuangia sp. YIM S09857]|uniref:hypothetical protein n=1 Tax=Yinghuangia sp. YIM S09857 TaxID=3436929 RepID=UPI003F52923E
MRSKSPDSSPLTWDDVDPARHPFDPATVAGVIDGLPTDRFTRALVDRYGRWAAGWAWTRNNSGGPVTVWCCWAHPRGGLSHAELVEAALTEWRTWLEALASRFEALAPPLGTPRERSASWEHAVTVLVTDVVERTGASEMWHAHGTLVLDWFLAHQGVPAKRRGPLLDKAIRGRFADWNKPDPELLADVARRVAAAAEEAIRRR